MKNNNVKYSAEIVNEFLKWQTYSCIMWILFAITLTLLAFWFLRYAKRNKWDDGSEFSSTEFIFYFLTFLALGVICFFSYRLVHIIIAPNHYAIENLYDFKYY